MNIVTGPRSRDLEFLAEGLSPDILIDDVQGMTRFSRDWSGDHFAMPRAVARPRSALELSTLMRRCFDRRILVAPQGGLTGLVAGAVAAPNRQEIVVSLERMASVRSVNPIDFAMIVEAGCVLENAKRAAETEQCFLPITFGAQGSCQVGGNVATNAGGFNVLRYGMARDLVLGLEVVLADGRIWDGLRILRKDNRGYDLKQLFIGSEGTLGIITAVAFKLFPKPTQVETAWIGLRSVEDAMAFYAKVRRSSSDLLSAFELILRDGLEVALRARPHLPDPLAKIYPVYVLMELSASGGVDLAGMMESALADAGDTIVDGVIAKSLAQSERLWLYREVMVEAQGNGGRYLRTDVSTPISMLADFLTEALTNLRAGLPRAKPIAYGHVGDGNIHINVVPPLDFSPEQAQTLFQEAEGIIYAAVDRFGGSISAEHGIGRLKQKAFLERIDDVSLDLANQLKKALDPRSILGMGRILPDDSNPPLQR